MTVGDTARPQEPVVDNEAQLISDGGVLALIGDPTAVDCLYA